MPLKSKLGFLTAAEPSAFCSAVTCVSSWAATTCAKFWTEPLSLPFDSASA